MKLIIEIDNITEHDAVALESALAIMQHLGNIGSSRWVCFYADGDGNFRPKIKVNGRKAEHTKLINGEDLWEHDEYRIDSDAIAWKLYELEEKT
jgi:hypothetical protein